MIRFNIRAKTVSEYSRQLSPHAAIYVPVGMSLSEVWRSAWRDTQPYAWTLAEKARRCVDHDRQCDAVMRKRSQCHTA